MKTSISQKIKTGIFTLLGILLFVAGIFLIGSKKNMFDDTFMIYGTFKNIGGLEVGNNIRFAGINVGTIKDIKIVSDTMIRVDMSLKSQVKHFLKKDALASIGSDGLMGDKLITIASGSANEVKLLNDGSRITTINPMEFDKEISKITNVAANAEIITRELATMVLQIRQGNGSISSLLYSNKLSSSLEGTADNAKALSSSLAGIASQVRSGKGSLGKLFYTNGLSDNLEKATRTATSAMATIDEGAYGFSENMKALQGNFFFRGYFKRKAKAAAEEAKLTGAKSTEAKAITVNIPKDTETGTAYFDEDMDEAELEQVIVEAQKALDAKRKNYK